MTLPTEEYIAEEYSPGEPSGELVHWMAPGRVQVGPAGLAATAVAAFALGLAAFAALQWLAPRREGLPPWRWRRGPLH